MAGSLGACSPGHRRAASTTASSVATTIGEPSPRLKIGPTTTFLLSVDHVISAFGSIWVSQSNRVARVDPRTGRAIATIPVPGTSDFRNLTAGAGAIWVD